MTNDHAVAMCVHWWWCRCGGCGEVEPCSGMEHGQYTHVCVAWYTSNLDAKVQVYIFISVVVIAFTTFCSVVSQWSTSMAAPSLWCFS